MLRCNVIVVHVDTLMQPTSTGTPPQDHSGHRGTSTGPTQATGTPPQGQLHRTTSTEPPPQEHLHRAACTGPPPQSLLHKAASTPPPPQGRLHMATSTRPPPQGHLHRTVSTVIPPEDNLHRNTSTGPPSSRQEYVVQGVHAFCRSGTRFSGEILSLFRAPPPLRTACVCVWGAPFFYSLLRGMRTH